MATNDVYLNPGTSVSFRESGGDVTFTPNGIDADTGRISARHNLDAGAAGAYPDEYVWVARTQFGAAPALGETVDIYWSSSDSTTGNADGGFSSSDADILNADEDHLKNLTFIGSIVADEAAADTEFRTAGVFRATRQYGQVVWWNNSAADALKADAGAHEFEITPIPMQVQS